MRQRSTGMEKASPGLSTEVRRPVKRKLNAGLVAALAVLITGLAVVLNKFDVAVVDTLDKHVGDWRIALGSPRAPAQRNDIAVILIAEDTLLDYESRSPIDRSLIAETIRAIDLAGPKAIGLDFIFDRRTRNDQKLIAALREAKAPIVLGNIDERVTSIAAESLAIQTKFIEASGRPHGHLMLARKEGFLAGNDSIVRYVAKPYDATADNPEAIVPGATRGLNGATPAASPQAFVDVLAVAAGFNHKPETRAISWLRPPDDRTPTFLTLTLPRHNPDTVKPALEGLFLPSWREFLKGRVVLIGADMIDRDQHTTPLSVIDKSAIPGIYIHAQALAQRIDGNRDIEILPDWIVALVSAIVAVCCFLTAHSTGVKPYGFAYGFVGLALIGAASLCAYSYYRIDFPSIALTTAWALGGLSGLVIDWFGHRSRRAKSGRKVTEDIAAV